MATIPQSILGAVKETMGITEYLLGRQNVMRSSINNAIRKPTTLPVIQLKKIKLCNRFTKAFKGTGFFDKSFPSCGNTGNGANRVTSVLMSQAVTGSYPNLYLYFPRVLISKGKLPPAEHAAATTMKDGNLYFSFTDNSDSGSASATDKIILVAYAEALHQAAFSLHAGLRKNCEAVLNTTKFKGYAVETWIGFLSDDETDASNSIYTGRLQL